MEIIYKYTLQEGQVTVQEGEPVECGNCYYVQFELGKAPEKALKKKDIGRVWKDGSVLWLTKRDDELAKQLFTQYGVNRIVELQKEIDQVADMITLVRHKEFIFMSKCFGVADGVDETELKDSGSNSSNVRAAVSEDDIYDVDERTSVWKYDDYKNPEQYVRHKLKMLRKEMFIRPTDKEVVHLKSLTTRTAIDNAVHSIIDRHWGD